MRRCCSALTILVLPSPLEDWGTGECVRIKARSALLNATWSGWIWSIEDALQAFSILMLPVNTMCMSGESHWLFYPTDLGCTAWMKSSFSCPLHVYLKELIVSSILIEQKCLLSPWSTDHSGTSPMRLQRRELQASWIHWPVLEFPTEKPQDSCPILALHLYTLLFPTLYYSVALLILEKRKITECVS